ncbi:MAG: serine/threonine protein kinase [Phycisphaerales bacterium]|nr:serine/threonine protein kinase [Phycisphaerales bacterium]
MADPLEIFGYKVLARLGEGAASTIYAVQEPKTGQVWALKHVLKNTDKDQRFLDQVEQEHEIGSKFRHPNIRKMERIHRRRKRFRTVEVALLMELVDAPSLDVNSPDSVLSCARVFTQIAEGISHMHDMGYVHADMKPTNVLVNDGMVKVIDLGQTCPIGTVKPRIQGTPGYIAPEQAHRRKITPETDIYNFGATMYWVLIREVIPTALPPRGTQGSLNSGAIETDRIPPPKPPQEINPHIPEALSDLVLDCVRVPRGARPESMEFVASRLRTMCNELAASYE